MPACAQILQRYRAVTALPLFARPNAGTPTADKVYPRSPLDMAAHLPDLLEAGARQLDRVERSSRLDGVIDLVRRAVRRVIPPGPVADALHGTWLGHPLHPALTDVPVGAWVGAAVLDAVPDQEAAATALVGLGLAAAVPSAVTGYNDWAAAGREQAPAIEAQRDPRPRIREVHVGHPGRGLQVELVPLHPEVPVKHGLRLDHGFEPVAVCQQDVALVGAVVAGRSTCRPARKFCSAIAR